MRIAWHPEAISGVKSAVDFGVAHWPAQAADLASYVVAAVEHLAIFPLSGRQGKAEGSRELILSKYPLIVVYAPTAEKLLVLRVIHQRQKWPDQ